MRKTSRNELGETIDFLKDLVGVMQKLYGNGREPILGNRDLTQEKKAAPRERGPEHSNPD